MDKAELTTEVEAPTIETTDGPTVEVADGFDFTTFSSRKKVAAVQGPTPEELLSEAWKEEETEPGGASVVQIIIGVLVAVGLAAFSQVPVGQDTTDLASFGGAV